MYQIFKTRGKNKRCVAQCNAHDLITQEPSQHAQTYPGDNKLVN